eukprot:CAMPEP_0204224682 /NCGR_PEP_ID=MMETSP0361-20130328/83634_1 /ASSEMBLY_ACC=CAM_ASM_000343 /TAXON_ID=268821 /ORGANISM="Scrippsiella Hangoei, Strain SHTV-5" /LENGTH=177 /DNA_ID=CAMNT_0051190775 /DNA_START=269 /DNA_END=800 /DNA_ORIENTATION=+
MPSEGPGAATGPRTLAAQPPPETMGWAQTLRRQILHGQPKRLEQPLKLVLGVGRLTALLRQPRPGEARTGSEELDLLLEPSFQQGAQARGNRTRSQQLAGDGELLVLAVHEAALDYDLEDIAEAESESERRQHQPYERRPRGAQHVPAAAARGEISRSPLTQARRGRLGTTGLGAGR